MELMRRLRPLGGGDGRGRRRRRQAAATAVAAEDKRHLKPLPTWFLFSGSGGSFRALGRSLGELVARGLMASVTHVLFSGGGQLSAAA